MEINSVFLSRTEQIKFKIVGYLAAKRGRSLSISDIAENFLLSYSQMLRYLGKISDDHVLFFQAAPNLDFSSGEVFVNEDFPEPDVYRSCLVKQSIPFRFLLCTLEDDIELTQFCSENDISRATFYKKTGPLLAFVKQFELRFTYQPIRIMGAEFGIRQFCFIIFWTLCKGEFWPFKVKKQEISAILDDFLQLNQYKGNLIVRNQLFFLFAILYERNKRGYVFQVAHQEELETLLEKSIILQLPSYFLKNGPEVFKRESAYFRLVTLIYRFHMIPLRRQDLQESLEIPLVHPVSKCSHFIVEKLKQKKLIFAEKEQIDMVFYNCFILYYLQKQFILADFLNDSHILSLDMNEKKEQIEKTVALYRRRIIGYLGPVNVNFLAQKIAKKMLEATYFVHYREKKFRVGILMENSHPFLFRIIQGLSCFSNIIIQEVHTICDDLDFVIFSDYAFKKHVEHLPNFYWQTHFSSEEFILLMQTIQVHVFNLTKKKSGLGAPISTSLLK